jgi:hypothetical protein
VCDCSDQAAHYHNLGPKLGASLLTRHIGWKQKKKERKVICIRAIMANALQIQFGHVSELRHEANRPSAFAGYTLWHNYENTFKKRMKEKEAYLVVGSNCLLYAIHCNKDTA